MRDLALTRKPARFDLDIAVFGGTDEVRWLSRRSSELGFAVRQNSFGGLKISTRTSLDIDVWAWPEPRSCLDQIDFGVNAICCWWPHFRIEIHPQWRRDLQRCEVESLSLETKPREVTIVRALALCERLSAALASPVALGPVLSQKAESFAAAGTEDEFRRAADYVLSKSSTRRWTKLESRRAASVLPHRWRSVLESSRNRQIARATRRQSASYDL